MWECTRYCQIVLLWAVMADMPTERRILLCCDNNECRQQRTHTCTHASVWISVAPRRTHAASRCSFSGSYVWSMYEAFCARRRLGWLVSRCMRTRAAALFVLPQHVFPIGETPSTLKETTPISLESPSLFHTFFSLYVCLRM